MVSAPRMRTDCWLYIAYRRYPRELLIANVDVAGVVSDVLGIVKLLMGMVTELVLEVVSGQYMMYSVDVEG